MNGETIKIITRICSVATPGIALLQLLPLSMQLVNPFVF